jgi:glycosyltransferase involved in cell wall biosynthesis
MAHPNPLGLQNGRDMPPNAMRPGPRAVAYAFLDFGNGGAQRLTVAACRHLDPERYRPFILCARSLGPMADEAVAAGIPVHALGVLRGSRDLTAAPRMARALRRLRPSILHLPLYSRSYPYWRLAARMAGVPVVIAHEWSRPTPPSLPRRLADRAQRPGTRFIAASEAHQHELLAAGAPSDDVAVVYSGIEVERFSWHADDRPSVARRLLGLPESRPLVLVPARLHPMKGHIDLLAAVPLLLCREPRALVVLAGDGPLRAVLPAAVESAGLADAVRFLGQVDDMPRLMAAADVVALSSRVEGLPSVIMEAFAARRPVVATAVGGVPEAVQDGVTGWLVPPRAPDMLADAIAAALGDERESARRATAGQQVVLERFTARQAAERLQDLYDAWLDETGDAGLGRGAGAPAIQ